MHLSIIIHKPNTNLMKVWEVCTAIHSIQSSRPSSSLKHSLHFYKQLTLFYLGKLGFSVWKAEFVPNANKQKQSNYIAC